MKRERKKERERRREREKERRDEEEERKEEEEGGPPLREADDSLSNQSFDEADFLELVVAREVPQGGGG